MKNTLIFILLFIITTTVCNAQDDDYEMIGFGENQEEKDKMTDFLGFMLLPGSNSLVRFYEVHFNYNGTIKYTQLTMDSFMHRCAGKERSMANPTKTNLQCSNNMASPAYKTFATDTICLCCSKI